MLRSAFSGEMNEQITIKPASTINLATSDARLMFSVRSASSKPRSLFKRDRRSSPSRWKARYPMDTSFSVTMLPMVVFPLADRPVSHKTSGFCFFTQPSELLPTNLLCPSMFRYIFRSSVLLSINSCCTSKDFLQSVFGGVLCFSHNKKSRNAHRFYLFYRVGVSEQVRL